MPTSAQHCIPRASVCTLGSAARQTDRSLRKAWAVVKRKIHKKLYAALLAQWERGTSLPLQEKEFMKVYESVHQQEVRHG